MNDMTERSEGEAEVGTGEAGIDTAPIETAPIDADSSEAPMIETTSAEGEPLIHASSTDHPLFGAVVEACRTVYDPEIPVNIYDLGLVYTILISDQNDVTVVMTLTAPGCPVAGEMPGWVAQAIEPIAGVKSVDVQMTFFPPWGMEMMSDEARLELGFM